MKKHYFFIFPIHEIRHNTYVEGGIVSRMCNAKTDELLISITVIYGFIPLNKAHISSMLNLLHTYHVCV